jgi:hypothetical protein
MYTHFQQTWVYLFVLASLVLAGSAVYRGRACHRC